MGGERQSGSLTRFFEAIEGSAPVGNWSEADRIQVAVLKLTNADTAFYNGSVELHEPNVTWATFKATFQRRFRDVRTDQYHFTQLQMPRQKGRDTTGFRESL